MSSDIVWYPYLIYNYLQVDIPEEILRNLAHILVYVCDDIGKQKIIITLYKIIYFEDMFFVLSFILEGTKLTVWKKTY